MIKLNQIHHLSQGGILTALTIIFQAAPVFLPTIGLILSPVSTFFVAIGAITNITLGVFIFISSAIILLTISIEEALVYIFTTGILGLIIGFLLYRQKLLICLIISSLTLSLGMFLLTLIINLSGFNEIVNGFPIIQYLSIFVLFSLLYSFLWIIGLKKLLNNLHKKTVVDYHN